jgi:hypothetical protein
LGWLVYGVLRHFQQYFSYIVAVRFIGGGFDLIFGVLTPLSTIFQLYHGEQ